MANTAFRIAELDPIQIKANLKEFLRSQSEFIDFDFEGSAINILLDILVRNTHYMAFYLNMIGSEAFIDTAQLRSSMVSHAKQIGYTPRSRTAAQTTVQIVVTPSINEDQDQSSLTIPKWTEFMSEAKDGMNYPFVTVQAYSSTKSNSSFSFANVVLMQGQVISRIYEAVTENPNRRFTIPSANVDTRHVNVLVQESSGNTYTEIYNRFSDIQELTANSRVFFLEETSTGNGTYDIYFGDGVLGKNPSDGNIIIVTYLDTNGAAANKIESFVLVDAIDGFDDDVEITPDSPSSGGSERETVNEIRQKAPIAYTTQNRAVTRNDYKTLILQDYTNVNSIAVWGGEENDPPIYGKIFISLKPKNGYRITDTQKSQIIDSIVRTRSVMTVIPEIIEPDYHYILTRLHVHYDTTKTNKSEHELEAIIRNTISTFRNNYLSKFESKFRVSNLQREIENSDPSITSCYIVPFVQKRQEILIGETKRYEIDFGQRISKGQINDKLYTTPGINIFDSTGTERECYLEEVPYAYTGIDEIEILSAGQKYEDATVEISGDGTGATATAKIVNGRIETITVTNRGENYTRAFITITSNTGYGASARAILQFNRGTLRLFYYRTNGQKQILNSEAGTINYETGKLVVSDLLINSTASLTRYDSDIWTFVARPEEPDLTPVRNVIYDLDTNDSASIVITMVPE